MKSILTNWATLYFTRLLSALLAYPVLAFLADYLLRSKPYVAGYFDALTFWYYFIGHVVYALLWSVGFYLLAVLIKRPAGAAAKTALFCGMLFILETFVEYQHDILKNRTFFSEKIFEAGFAEHCVYHLILTLVFLFLYLRLGRKFVQRPGNLP